MIRILMMFAVLIGWNSCNSYSALPPLDPVDPKDPVEPPFACTAEFAEDFAEPFHVVDGAIRYAQFSPDCGKLWTVDETTQRLRVTDLASRQTLELVAGVYLAWFTRDSQRVLFLLPTADISAYELYLAGGETAQLIDTRTTTTVLQSPDGKSIAYLKDYDPESYLADLVLARIDTLPPQIVRVAGGVMGTPAYTPDGRLVFQDDAEPHHIERDDLWCDWTTTRLRAFRPGDGTFELLGEDVLAWTSQVSEDGKRVYAATDYDCEGQVQSLMAYSLGGAAPVRLFTGPPMFLGPQEMLELPERGEILHPWVSWSADPEDYRSELWATRTDGSGSEVLAEEVMSQMQTCMYFIPVQRAFDDVLLYLHRESYELMALDRSGEAWEVRDGSGGLWYQLAPDGRSLLSYSDEYSPADLVLTQVAGGQSRVLMSGLIPGTESAWTSTGERVLLLSEWMDGGGSRTLYSIDPVTGGSTVMADDVRGEWLYGNTFVVHPGGRLVAVQRQGGMFISLIP